ncbi:NlpC/P60 family protein [Parasedimentitalea maritima]|uniref:NlpC/P60 family protein n=1 Tax=Parasedimentitalea maritima TaxID=2578117 RepID=A0ABY2V001_9RHOB|nr:NlpC/P60 family protein [Zongyanglinia marina]TLP68847.1 NlpC/P60 family protein [Zongyanglinia marina]
MKTKQIIQPVTDLLRSPYGARDRQMIYGDLITVEAEENGWAQILSIKDGYQGYLPSIALGAQTKATHRISAASSHIYVQPDFKSRDLCSLSFGSRVQVLTHGDRFCETPNGFIPTPHLKPADTTDADPVALAGLFLGTPYLWGGNSRFGIDCSGLVQAALLACGIPCPGDTGPQESSVGHTLPPGSTYQRGDLLFWKGHVAFVYDPETIIHANAHDMAVALEPLQAAIDRIQAQGDGPVTAHKRLT